MGKSSIVTVSHARKYIPPKGSDVQEISISKKHTTLRKTLKLKHNGRK